MDFESSKLLCCILHRLETIHSRPRLVDRQYGSNAISRFSQGDGLVFESADDILTQEENNKGARFVCFTALFDIVEMMTLCRLLYSINGIIKTFITTKLNNFLPILKLVLAGNVQQKPNL